MKYSKKKNNGETTTTKAGFDSAALQRPKLLSVAVRQLLFNKHRSVNSNSKGCLTETVHPWRTLRYAIIASLLLRDHAVSLTMKIKCPEMYQLLLPNAVSGVKRIAPQAMAPTGNAPKRLAPMPVSGWSASKNSAHSGRWSTTSTPRSGCSVPVSKSAGGGNLLLTPPPARPTSDGASAAAAAAAATAAATATTHATCCPATSSGIGTRQIIPLPPIANCTPNWLRRRDDGKLI